MCIHMTDMKLFQSALAKDLEDLRDGDGNRDGNDDAQCKVDDV